MILLKFTGKDGRLITAAARALDRAKKQKNKHVRAEDAAKDIIARELKSKRAVDLEVLPDKEFVVVQCDDKDVVKVEIKTSDRFDGKAFGLVHEALAAEFTRETPAKHFDSLLK